jgi:hypothetical protein
MSTGRFYITAGMKWRAPTSISFSQILKEQDWFYNNDTGIWYQIRPNQAIPSVPFGPNTPGAFGTGTGKPTFASDPNPWVYDNGVLDSTNPGVLGNCNITPGFTNEPTRYCDAEYPKNPSEPNCSGVGWVCPGTSTNPSYALGQWLVDLPITTCTPICVPTLTPTTANSGSFVINDPIHQANADNPVQTTTVTFSRLWDSGLRITSNEFQDFQRLQSIWSPTFEIGFSSGGFVDVFYGISFYNTQASHSRQSHVYKVNEARMAIKDVIPFASNTTKPWDPAFDSTSPTLGPSDDPGVITEDHAYFLLSPDGQMNGTFPIRSFYSVANYNTSTQENIIENINQNFSAFVLENRFGGRGSTSFLGIGNLGLSVGMVINKIWYQVNATRKVTAQGPNYAGMTIFNLSSGRPDALFYDGPRNTWLNLGGFISSDIDVAIQNVFVKASVDYASCYYEKYRMMDTLEAELNFGGWSFTISAGIGF